MYPTDPIQLLQMIILILAGARATYTDMSKGIIEDWLNLSLAIIGLGLIIFTNQNLIVLFQAITIFVIGFGLHILGFMGAGDTKFLVGVSLVQPFLVGFPFGFFVMFVAGILGLMSEIIWPTKTKRLGPYLLASIMFCYTILYVIGA